jgi:YidC/Oxa1 family membrane protein insertase
MTDRNRTIFAVIFSIVIVVAWQKFYVEPRIPKGNSAPVVAVQNQATPDVAPSIAAPAPATVVASAPGTLAVSEISEPVPALKVELKKANTELLSGSELFGTWHLNEFTRSQESQSEKIQANDVTHYAKNVLMEFEGADFAPLARLHGAWSQKSPTEFVQTVQSGQVSWQKEVTLSEDGQTAKVSYKGSFVGSAPKAVWVSVLGKGIESDPEEQDRGLLVYHNKEIERFNFSSDIKQADFQVSPKWVAVGSRYFVYGLLPSSEISRVAIQPWEAKGGKGSLVFPVKDGKFDASFQVFFGAKKLEWLRSVDVTLDSAVDLGWFTVIAYPLLWFLMFLHKLVGNYGWAIIILTLLLKVATYPLTYKSMKSMKQMAKIQPEIKKLQERFKDDKESLNREMMTLMKTQGYNPMAGCLPVLMQMPIFIALYRVLYSAVELYQAPFMLWIHDLSIKDPFYVTPVLLTVAMFLQQKMTPTTAADPAQQKMMQFMPIMFGAFMVTLPAGLTVYMLVNTLAGILQQWVLNRKFDGPQGSLAKA